MIFLWRSRSKHIPNFEGVARISTERKKERKVSLRANWEREKERKRERNVVSVSVFSGFLSFLEAWRLASKSDCFPLIDYK